MWTSLFTMPFGLTEPLFVPAYWSPPSLFDLARTTGFDIESFIFSFGIGGVGAVLYNLWTGRELVPVEDGEKLSQQHKLHSWAMAVPFLSFPILYTLPLKSDLCGHRRHGPGRCRRDLVSAGLGAEDVDRRRPLRPAYYTVFLIGLEVIAPGYIARVWNLGALSGVNIGGMPIEELLFAAAFGAYFVERVRALHVDNARTTACENLSGLYLIILRDLTRGCAASGTNPID